MAKKLRFPPQIKYIIGNEACERFSYYGMQSILTIFMVDHLRMATQNAEASFHLFVSACYLLTILGGYLADKALGKYKTILYLSLVYCLGHGVLAMSESRAGLFWGLGLIALGAGGIKSSVSSYVGDQFTRENEGLIEKIYDVFYFSINFGAFFSTLLIPWLLAHYGSRVAFGVPGILMLVATVVFWMGRGSYINAPPSSEKPKTAEEKAQGLRDCIDIGKVFLLISGFWALWNQYGSSWTLQADQMNRDIHVFSHKIHVEASQVSALNAIMILVLIPLFAYVVYPGVEKIFKIKLTPLRKMGAGMFVAAASFVFVGFLQIPLDHGHKISVAWQFFPYLIVSISEVMISIPGLELAYTQAPPKMKSTVMSLWMLTIFFGNMLVAFVAKLNVFHGAEYFFFYAALAVIMGIGFIAIAMRYRYRDYVGKAAR